jgi:hypothetical protein
MTIFYHTDLAGDRFRWDSTDHRFQVFGVPCEPHQFLVFMNDNVPVGVFNSLDEIKSTLNVELV